MRITPTEHEEQKALHSHVNLLKKKHKNILLNFAIPNGTYKKSIASRNHYKQEGLVSGIPDYCIVFKNLVLFIELKRAKKSLSKVSNKQKEVIKKINESNTTYARVAYGNKEAIVIIKEFIEIDKMAERMDYKIKNLKELR